MKKLLIIQIVILSFLSCNKNDDTDHKLLNCAVEYLNFTDDYRFGWIKINYPPNDALKTRIYFDYSGDKIVKITGGFRVIPNGSNFNNFLFSLDVQDSIVYKRDSIFVFTNPHYYYYYLFSDNPNKATVFIYDSQNRLHKLIRRDDFEIIYSYANNQIIEKDKNGKILRKLYFENSNLIKVEKEIIDNQGIISYKKDILFQEFDNKPNPFKNKYYLFGAYYRAFSDNNYKGMTINEYSLINDSLVLYNTYSYTMPIIYNPDNYPLFGNYK